MCMYARVCMYVYACESACVHMCVCVRVYACVCACMCMRESACVHMCVHVCLSLHACKRACARGVPGPTRRCWSHGTGRADTGRVCGRPASSRGAGASRGVAP